MFWWLKKRSQLLQIGKELMEQIFAECRKRYPEEACGFVIVSPEGAPSEGRKATRVVPAVNIQNAVHTRDPKRYPRDAKTAYSIDPKEWDRVKQEAERDGEIIVAIFHSHPEHDVYFSAEDKGMAAPWGEPLFPDQSYLVISVYGGKIKGASEFYWDGSKKDFVEKKIT